MKAPLVKIGKDKAVVLREEVLEQYGITDDVYLSLKDDHIIIKRKARDGWNEAFEAANKKGSLLVSDIFQDEEFEPWD